VSEFDHVLGGDRAAVELVAYGDYQCPYCVESHLIIESLFGLFGRQLRFVFRNFPLTRLHPQAMAAAILAESAGFQGKFWQMHDTLFDQHEALDEAHLARCTRRIGLDPERLRDDLPAAQARVRADLRSGARSGVNGTPAFFVNGERYEGPWWDVCQFASVLADVGQRLPLSV
jgi:protein-disulfide isomerase